MFIEMTQKLPQSTVLLEKIGRMQGIIRNCGATATQLLVSITEPHRVQRCSHKEHAHYAYHFETE